MKPRAEGFVGGLFDPPETPDNKKGILPGTANPEKLTERPPGPVTTSRQGARHERYSGEYSRQEPRPAPPFGENEETGQ